MTMIDQTYRDRLREALKQLELRGGKTASQAAKDGIGSDLLHVLEAARLVADPDTLIVEKVNGEWPELLYQAAAEGIAADDTMTDPRYWTRVARNAVNAALDALLAQQTGDIE